MFTPAVRKLDALPQTVDGLGRVNRSTCMHAGGETSPRDDKRLLLFLRALCPDFVKDSSVKMGNV